MPYQRISGTAQRLARRNSGRFIHISRYIAPVTDGDTGLFVLHWIKAPGRGYTYRKPTEE